MIIITSRQAGFRRCGVAHPAEPTEYADGVFTPEQLTILRAEPMLMVLEGEAETEAPAKGKGGKEKTSGAAGEGGQK